MMKLTPDKFKNAEYITHEDIKLLNRFTEERNIKDATVKGYWSTFKKYTNFHRMSITELIDEAKREQKSGVNPNESKLRQRLLDYRRHLMKTMDARSTIKSYESKIETFYSHWAIYLPQLPQAKIEKGYIAGWGDLPTVKHMRKAIEHTPKLKPYILFAMSSGTAKAECLSITVDMFLKGCEKYTDTTGKPEEVLHSLEDRRDIVPSIYIRRIKTDKWYTTFCSPEASMAIINELIGRENLDREDKIFPYSSSSIITAFQEINDHFQWGWVGKYRLFRSHTLRKFNASNIGLPAEDVDAIQGRSRNSVHETYIKHNPDELKRKYMKVMHRVMCYPKNYPICRDGVYDANCDSFGNLRKEQPQQVMPQSNQVVQNNPAPQGDNISQNNDTVLNNPMPNNPPPPPMSNMVEDNMIGYGGGVSTPNNNNGNVLFMQTAMNNNTSQLYMEIGKLQEKVEKLENMKIEQLQNKIEKLEQEIKTLKGVIINE